MADTHIGNINDPELVTFGNTTTACKTDDCRIVAGAQTETSIVAHYPNPETFIGSLNASIVYANNSFRKYTVNPSKMVYKSGNCVTETVESFGKRVESEAKYLIGDCGDNPILRAQFKGSVSVSFTINVTYIKKAETTSCGTTKTIRGSFADSESYGPSTGIYTQKLEPTQKLTSQKPNQCGNFAAIKCGTKQLISFPKECPYCCIFTARCAIPCNGGDDFNCKPIDENQTQLGSYLSGGASLNEWIANSPTVAGAAGNLKNLMHKDYQDAIVAIQKKIFNFAVAFMGNVPENCMITKKEYTGVSVTIT